METHFRIIKLFCIILKVAIRYHDENNKAKRTQAAARGSEEVQHRRDAARSGNRGAASWDR